jgi:hypothetical protein
MKKVDRERKSRYRFQWSHRIPRNGYLSYPMWLEGELERYEGYHENVCAMNRIREWRCDAAGQYIRDLEQSLVVVERVARSIQCPQDRKAVWSSIAWVKSLLRDAKDRFENGVRAESERT